MHKQVSTYPPILMIASARHDAPYASTAMALAKELSRYSPVYFVDNPFTWKDFFTGKKKKQIEKRYSSTGNIKSAVFRPYAHLPNLHIVVSPLMVPNNFLPAGKLYTQMRHWNMRRLAKHLQHIFRIQNVQDYIFLNSFNPFYWELPDYLKGAKARIYQTVDRIGHSLHVKKHGVYLEAQAMHSADLGLTTSEFLSASYAGTGRVQCLPNAVDVDLFLPAAEKAFDRPADWPVPVGEPVALYTGHLDMRVDTDLLDEVCRQLPEVNFVFLGPRSGPGEVWARSMQHKNVFFIDRKPLEALPSYLQEAQLGIIPFRCNELTEAIYPLKINEYLAAGLPVVATPFSADIRSFSEHIALADTAEVYANAVKASLAMQSKAEKAKRQLLAKTNTWQARVKSFWQMLEDENLLSKNIGLNEAAA